MKAIKYSNAQHLATLHEWLIARNVPHLPQADEMPKVGVVVYEGEEPIAMAFLRRVEGNYSQLDGLTTNPSALGKTRSDCIDLAVSVILHKAKLLKVKHVLSFTEDDNTLLRSEKFGFVCHPQSKLIVVSLNKLDK